MDRIEREHLTNALGPVVTALLDQPGVTDIYLTEPLNPGEDGPIMVRRHGSGTQIAGRMGANEALNLIAAVAGTLGGYVTTERPWVEGELFGDGPRFDGMIPPATVAPVWAIRVPSIANRSLQSYVEDGTMTAAQMEAIETAAIERKNIVVAGATGTGKTTLLNAILGSISIFTPDHRVVTIEELHELRVAQRDKLRIRTGPHLSEQQAVRRALREIPDRIVVGEVRGPEAHAMILAWNTGHPGGLASLHSNTATPQDTLDRIEDMVALATPAPQQSAIARAVNVIVGLDFGTDGRRRVKAVSFVHGWERAADRYIITEQIP